MVRVRSRGAGPRPRDRSARDGSSHRRRKLAAGALPGDAVLTSERGGANGDGGGDGGADGSGDGPLGGVLTLAQIKRFVCYCRAKCAPRLSEEAARTLQSEYVAIRDNVRQRAISTGSEEAIPITVRLPSTPILSQQKR